MSSHESSDEWNERQAKNLQQHQCERSPNSLTDPAWLWQGRLDAERGLRIRREEEAVDHLNDLLDLIRPINDHDHRTYGCNWCLARDNAIRFCEKLREGWQNAKRT